LPSYIVIAADTLRDLKVKVKVTTFTGWPCESCDLDLSPFDLGQWLYKTHGDGGSRGQPLHQVWRSYGYPFLSSDISHRIPPWTVRLLPLRMRRIMWPMR